jgi:hypothetical protein
MAVMIHGMLQNPAVAPKKCREPEYRTIKPFIFSVLLESR